MLTASVSRSRMLWTALSIMLGLFAFILLTGGCEPPRPESAPTSPPPIPPPSPPAAPTPIEQPGAVQPEGASVIEVNSENFEQEVLNADTLVVVDFWAEWCAPCKALKPILVELAKEYADQVKFTSLDTDANQALARQYKVRAIPLLVFFKDGEEIHRLIGLRPKDDLKSEIDKILTQ